MNEDRNRWNAKHRNATGAALPSPSLELLPRAPSNATALELACGRGRNTERLARLGYRVVASDVSEVALGAVRERVPDAQLVQADLEHWPFRAASCDVVVQIDYLDRERLDDVAATVRPGGLLLIDTFFGEPGGLGPRNPHFRLRRDELVAVVDGWTLLAHDEGSRNPERAMILARRPSALTSDNRSATRST